MNERWTIRSIREAVAKGRLPEPFRPSAVNHSLGIGYAGTFLPKHRVGNPGGYTELFIQVSHRPALYRFRLKTSTTAPLTVTVPMRLRSRDREGAAGGD